MAAERRSDALAFFRNGLAEPLPASSMAVAQALLAIRHAMGGAIAPATPASATHAMPCCNSQFKLIAIVSLFCLQNLKHAINRAVLEAVNRADRNDPI
jgi:hypothetical protein